MPPAALGELCGRGAVHVIRKGVPGKATLYSLYAPELLADINPRLRSWLRSAAPVPEESE